MTTAITQEFIQNPDLLYRLTVGEYHRMIKSGALEEGAPFELLDGHVVRKIRGNIDNPMTINPAHATAVIQLSRLNPRLKKFGCHIRQQQPITLPPYDEPEPDGSIVRGTIEDYARGHPRPNDVLCVIEVAEASLRRDRGYKQQIYADAGIPTYVIIVLPEKTVEVYTRPVKGKGRYAQVVSLTTKQKVVIALGTEKRLTIPVRALLPSAAPAESETSPPTKHNPSTS